jgi:hypothetical protein
LLNKYRQTSLNRDYALEKTTYFSGIISNA